MVFISKKRRKDPKIQTSFRGRSYRYYNKNDFQQSLVNLDWSDYFSSTSSDEAWELLEKKIKLVLDRSCPIRNFRINKVKENWLPNEVLDKTLSFTKHITNTIKMASHKVYLLTKIRPYLTDKACLNVYKTMVLPYIEYGDIIYGGTNVSLKLSLNLLSSTNTLDVHREAKLNLLKDRRDSHLVTLMFQRAYDTEYVDDRELPTRLHDNKTLTVPRPNNSVFTKSVCFRGATMWNDLDPSFKQISNIKSFKAKQKILLRHKLT